MSIPSNKNLLTQRLAAMTRCFLGLFLAITVFASCTHRPISFKFQVAHGGQRFELEQVLYQSMMPIRMGQGRQGQPALTDYQFRFDLGEAQAIRYAYLDIVTRDVDTPQNPLFLNDHPIGFLKRSAYDTTSGVWYAGDQGPKNRDRVTHTQRYLPARYFKQGVNTIRFGHQPLRSAPQGGRIQYDRYTIQEINLAVYKNRIKTADHDRAEVNGTRRFPPFFSYFSELTDEELFIALFKLPALMAELTDPGNMHANCLAYVYTRIGDYYRWTGHYKKNLDYHLKAMHLRAGRAPGILAPKIRSQLGLAYYFMGDYREAVAECETALKEIQSERQAAHTHQEMLQTNRLELLISAYLALNHHHLGNQIETERYARQVINYFDDDWLHSHNRQRMIGEYIPISLAHQTLGDLALQQGRYEAALERYRQAQTYLRYETRPEIYNDQMIIIALSQAKVQYHLKRYQTARKILNGVTHPTNSFMWRAYLLQGMMAESEGDLTRACAFYVDAIREIEFARGKLTSHGLKINFMTDKQAPYARMVSCLTRLKNHTGAFNYAEKAKARAFLDLLATASGIVGQKDAEMLELTDQEQRLRQRVLDLQHEADMQNHIFRKRGSLPDLAQQTHSATQALGMFFGKTVSRNHDFASLRSTATLDVQAVQKMLPKGTGLVEYFYEGDHLYAWILNRKSVVGRVKKIDQATLFDLIQTHRELISRPFFTHSRSSGGNVAEKEIQRLAGINQELYDLLVDGVFDDLQSQRLYLIPHGVLHYLPFQTLFKNGVYLIERYQIGYAPSASTLKYVLAKNRGTGQRVLALGNPDLQNPQFDLEFAEQEVRDIQKLFSGARILTRTDATEAFFKEQAAEYDILHLASHGEFNPHAPMRSCLRLRGGKGEDGRLETQEIFDLSLNANLVTLSACNTGLGKRTNGDEVIGLTRAFLYAGTPSILASLWNVDDASTRELMTRFYTSLKSMDKIKALQQAQLSLIKAKRWGHPFYWAGFQVVGDYR